ncbi:AAC(3) family N-acetyltransferase [bacterium]|nr:AAC(3) family N-acetyltransferase [bacterium]
MDICLDFAAIRYKDIEEVGKMKIDGKNIQTLSSIEGDLKELGLKAADKIIVHSSLSSIGWVSGGANALIQALMNVVKEDGLLLMPGHSSSLTEPSYWENPPIPRDWWSMIRESLPAFDTKTTPTEWVGIVPELFRSYKGVLRSYHPSNSFLAWGKQADKYVSDHSLDYSLSDSSPLGCLYENSGKILFIGCDHDKSTSIHLAESRIENFPSETQGGPILHDGGRVWKEYEDYKYDSDDFSKIGQDYESKNKIATGLVGEAKSKLFPMRDIVDFAQCWISKNRK